MVRLIQQTTDQFAAAYSYFCPCPQTTYNNYELQ